jgi:serpin B
MLFLPAPFSLLRSLGAGGTSLARVALGCSAALAVGCGSTGGGQTGDEHSGPIEELKGATQRLAASGDLPNSASADGWSFAWKLYAAEADPSANTFFSPYSISVASSMLIAGAAGETKTEMADALDFSSDGDAFHQARNTVAQALQARNRTATPDQNAQTLRVVNDLWLEPSFRPLPTFLDTLSSYYGASSFLAPFATDPEAARLAINDKVATDTEQLIEELLPERSITDDTAFVLTNALYFKARWNLPFQASLTADAPFEAQSGQTVQVPMMHTELVTSHVATDDYEAVALPYDQNQLELVAIMPRQGSFDGFVEALSAAEVARIADELAPINIELSFPKVGIDSEVPLKERLVALGMRQAFEPGADFSALTSAPVYISDAFHKATLEIDEEGTVAAAATAFVGVAVSAPPPPIPVTFDRPFVFFIRDIQTNALLFVGHYANP